MNEKWSAFDLILFSCSRIVLLRISCTCASLGTYPLLSFFHCFPIAAFPRDCSANTGDCWRGFECLDVPKYEEDLLRYVQRSPLCLRHLFPAPVTKLYVKSTLFGHITYQQETLHCVQSQCILSQNLTNMWQITAPWTMIIHSEARYSFLPVYLKETTTFCLKNDWFDGMQKVHAHYTIGRTELRILQEDQMPLLQLSLSQMFLQVPAKSKQPLLEINKY